MGEQAKPVALVVEDNEATGTLIQVILKQEGFDVHRAADGRLAEEAIEKFAPPALITLDVNLPDTSGGELLLRIRARRGWEKVPVIMVTAKENDSKVGWAIKSGASAYIVKPFEREALLECVKRVRGN
jgi:DNA-binding response OmpR family regulator